MNHMQRTKVRRHAYDYFTYVLANTQTTATEGRNTKDRQPVNFVTSFPPKRLNDVSSVCIHSYKDNAARLSADVSVFVSKTLHRKYIKLCIFV